MECEVSTAEAALLSFVLILGFSMWNQITFLTKSYQQHAKIPLIKSTELIRCSKLYLFKQQLYAWEYHQVNQCLIVDIRKLHNGEHIYVPSATQYWVFRVFCKLSLFIYTL